MLKNFSDDQQSLALCCLALLGVFSFMVGYMIGKDLAI
jgi:hypothetical protein